MTVEQQLEEIGLTKGESKVYIALVKKGPTTVGPIVKESGVAYSKIYEVLERLIKKGLATSITKEKTRVYNGALPHRIKEYLEEKKKTIEQQEVQLGTLLPEIGRLQKEKGEEFEAEVFTGWKGVRTAFERFIDLYKKGQPYKFFYYYDKETVEQSDAFFKKLAPQYKKKHVLFKGIAEERYKTSGIAEYIGNAEIRYTKFPVPANIEILGEHILITSWKKPTTIYIKNKDIAQQYESYFDHAWKEAKK